MASLDHHRTTAVCSRSLSGGGAQQHERVGQYTIGRRIGKGNFATVKLARHQVAKAKVAVKIVDKHAVNPSNLNKIHREINILKSLNHPHVIKLYQVMESDRYLYIVTEYAGGGELFGLLVSRGRQGEPESRRLFRQLVAAVTYCHGRGVVHRDLKAENVLIDRHGDVKLIDFGFSNYHTPGEGLSTWCGSPPYAAPELFMGHEYDGTKADVWSLGVILYILVSGGFPFPGTSIEKLKRAVLSGLVKIPYWVSVECSDLIRKMLVVVAAKRYTIFQVTNHRWFVDESGSAGAVVSSDDSTDDTDVDGGADAAAPALNSSVLAFMHQRASWPPDKVTESIIEKRFDSLYSTYHILCDKLRRHSTVGGTGHHGVTARTSLPVLTAAAEQPRRGSRGSITTGVANMDLSDHLRNVISAADIAKLDLSSSPDDEDESVSDHEGLAPEPCRQQPTLAPPCVQPRRHTLCHSAASSQQTASLLMPSYLTPTLGVYQPPPTHAGPQHGGAFGGALPPMVQMPSGPLSVPFPLDQVMLSNLMAQSNAAFYQNAYFQYLSVPNTADPYNPMRRASDGETPLLPNRSGPVAMDQAQEIDDALSVLTAHHTNARRPRSSTEVDPQSPADRAVSAIFDSNVLDQQRHTANAVEAAGRDYLRRLGRFKRNTIHSPTDLPVTSGVQRQQLGGPVFSAHRHSAGGLLTTGAAATTLPYGRTRRGSSPAAAATLNTTQFNQLLALGLRQGGGAQSADSPTTSSNVQALQRELQQLSTDAAAPLLQTVPQQLSPGQTSSSARSTPPHAAGGGSPLDVIDEQHDMEVTTTWTTASPLVCRTTDTDVPDGGGLLMMMPPPSSLPPLTADTVRPTAASIASPMLVAPAAGLPPPSGTGGGGSWTPRISITNEYNEAMFAFHDDDDQHAADAVGIDVNDDPILAFQQQAQQIVFGGALPLAPVDPSCLSDETSPVGGGGDFSSRYYYAGTPDKPQAGGGQSSSAHGLRRRVTLCDSVSSSAAVTPTSRRCSDGAGDLRCVVSDVAMAQLFARLTAVLDRKRIAYQELSPTPPYYPIGDDGASADDPAPVTTRRLSLESDDGTRVEIGLTSVVGGSDGRLTTAGGSDGHSRPSSSSSGGVKSRLEMRCLEGDFHRYNSLCTELISGLRL